jgi:hypothetical protein
MTLMEIPLGICLEELIITTKTTVWLIVGVAAEIRKTYLSYASQKRYRLNHLS